MRIRATTEEDWEGFREVRLRALAESPGAFASTLEQEQDLPEREWRDRAAGRSRQVGGISYVAVDESGAFVGLVAGFADEEEPDAVHLVAMWVAPEARRRGVARALIHAVVDWAGTRGARQVRLFVADGNDAARTLYEREGFRFTGIRMPLPSNPEIWDDMLVLDLPPAH
jgi:ribosomal protein S18 acetylase RimI-like enzyme